MCKELQPQALPIHTADIWRAHLGNVYKDLPINQINSQQYNMKEKRLQLRTAVIPWEELTTQITSLQPRQLIFAEVVQYSIELRIVCPEHLLQRLSEDTSETGIYHSISVSCRLL